MSGPLTSIFQPPLVRWRLQCRRWALIAVSMTMESVIFEESSSEVHTLFNIQYPTKHWSGGRLDRRVTLTLTLAMGFRVSSDSGVANIERTPIDTGQPSWNIQFGLNKAPVGLDHSLLPACLLPLTTMSQLTRVPKYLTHTLTGLTTTTTSTYTSTGYTLIPPDSTFPTYNSNDYSFYLNVEQDVVAVWAIVVG